MNRRKTVWIFTGFTLALFFSAIIILPLSIYVGEKTENPDIYNYSGWAAALGLLFLSFLFGTITLGQWLSQRNQVIKLFENSQL